MEAGPMSYPTLSRSCNRRSRSSVGRWPAARYRSAGGRSGRGADPPGGLLELPFLADRSVEQDLWTIRASGNDAVPFPRRPAVGLRRHRVGRVLRAARVDTEPNAIPGARVRLDAGGVLADPRLRRGIAVGE